ncbi:hypothetical protein [Sanguibacter massiliensis]|uniref:hypothetical protein n=1 Tax=Sanguibacter massiliensis TaxID=1973217 RepID=UPI000C846C4E|nr:hypothetical protein [Sanguibacter massiliensis]
MTPDQCTVIREHLSGYMLAAALLGGRESQKWLVESMYGSTRRWRTDGLVRWATLTRHGIKSGTLDDHDGTLVATWKDIQGHVDTLPADLAQRLRDAHAEHAALCRARNNAYREEHHAVAYLPWMHGRIAKLVVADAEATMFEHEQDVLAPLLDLALTYRAPVTPTQPDIFDLLAEVA